jgi:hypothetical protein
LPWKDVVDVKIFQWISGRTSISKLILVTPLQPIIDLDRSFKSKNYKKDVDFVKKKFMSELPDFPWDRFVVLDTEELNVNLQKLAEVIKQRSFK